MKKRHFDSLATGLVPGLILPLVTMIVIWAVKYEDGLITFLRRFQQMGILSKILSLSVIPNLLLFFVFLWLNRSFSARGVIFATLIMAFVMLMLKFA